MTNIGKMRCTAVFAALALAGSVLPASADLIGTQVSGSAETSINPGVNFFDPATGFVPAGFGNSSPNGPNNVVISASQTEFGLNSPASPSTELTADFTGNSLELKYVQPLTFFAVDFTFTFTDTAFAGLSIVPTSDNFPSPVTAGLVGNVLTLSAQPTGIGTFDAVFNITTTPLPAALPLFASGLGALSLFGWRRKRKAQAAA